jgi:hypothetical protein
MPFNLRKSPNWTARFSGCCHFCRANYWLNRCLTALEVTNRTKGAIIEVVGNVPKMKPDIMKFVPAEGYRERNWWTTFSFVRRSNEPFKEKKTRACTVNCTETPTTVQTGLWEGNQREITHLQILWTSNTLVFNDLKPFMRNPNCIPKEAHFWSVEFHSNQEEILEEKSLISAEIKKNIHVPALTWQKEHCTYRLDCRHWNWTCHILWYLKSTMCMQTRKGAPK